MIPIIDLFAGPGGLGEGFSRLRPSRGPRFRIALSIEREKTAHATLRLRSFFRQYEPSRVPVTYYKHLRGDAPLAELQSKCASKWEIAEREAMCAALGDPSSQEEIAMRISEVSRESGDRPLILIGGPPCQAYSLIGRARNRGIVDYVPEEDPRHELYIEYLKIIARTWPDVFIMENVKGILSSKLRGEYIFERIRDDLSNPRGSLKQEHRNGRRHKYRLYPVVVPTSNQTLFDPFDASDFIVRCEDLGIPQRRHRVIILGIRDDLDTKPNLLSGKGTKPPTVRETIGGLPRLRSGLSRQDSYDSWYDAVRKARLALDGTRVAAPPALTRGAEFVPSSPDFDRRSTLGRWFTDVRLGGTCNHTTRGHISEDLRRYMFAASWAAKHGQSPQLRDFPRSLLPKHKNAREAARSNSMFADRFRVQIWDEPSTTITSHISKDGHYYIHPDPEQCRSLTVREAARLQTFPDNYFFCGPRTSQYVQVGNAVPPMLAHKIAGIVHQILHDSGRI